MILQSFVFFDSRSKDTTSNVLSNPNDGTALQLQVTGENVDLIIECRADMEKEEWHEVGAISLLDYHIYDNITEEGLYQISMEGIRYCRVRSNAGVGNFKVYGNLTAD